MGNQPEVSWVRDPLKGHNPRAMSTLATGDLATGNDDDPVTELSVTTLG